jgi:hypothetical protein
MFVYMARFEVFYTGKGANKSGRHTKKKFLEICKALFGEMPGTEKYKFNDWLNYTGATDVVRYGKN